MAAEPCKKCGKLRKIDIVFAPDGIHQPPCIHCGDPGHIDPITDDNHVEVHMDENWDVIVYNRHGERIVDSRKEKS